MPKTSKKTGRKKRSRTASPKGLQGVILLTLLIESVFIVMLAFESSFAELFSLSG